MGIFTDRLALFLPGGGSQQTITPPDTADIDKLNDNFRTLDASVGYKLCLSTSRPAVPFLGQHIYETDTNRRYIWTGELPWKPISPTLALRHGSGTLAGLAAGDLDMDQGYTDDADIFELGVNAITAKVKLRARAAINTFWTPNTTGLRRTELVRGANRNSMLPRPLVDQSPVSSTAPQGISSISGVFDFEAGEVVRVQGQQTSGLGGAGLGYQVSLSLELLRLL